MVQDALETIVCDLRSFVIVDAVDDGQILAGARGGDQHLFGAGLQMLFRHVALGEDTGAFHHHVDAELVPGQVFRVAFGKHLHHALAGVDAGRRRLDLVCQRPVRGVALQQQGVHLDRAEIVDRDEFQILAPRFQRRAQRQPSDAAESR